MGGKRRKEPVPSPGLQLASSNRVNHEADLGLEDATRYALEQDFSFIPRLNPLQGVLLERRCQSPVPLAVVDENHGRTEGRRDHIHGPAAVPAR